MIKLVLFLGQLLWEVVSMFILVICSLYLVTKFTIYFELNESWFTILLIGMLFLSLYIHESIYKEARIRVFERLRKPREE